MPRSVRRSKSGRNAEIASLSGTISDDSGSDGSHRLKGLEYSVGALLEAQDYSNKWFPCRVLERDTKSNQIFVRFESWTKRFDEWISMTSNRIRPRRKTLVTGASANASLSDVSEDDGRSTPSSLSGGFCDETKKRFQVGDKVLAHWTDSKRYPAQVTKVLKELPEEQADEMEYEILFHDGIPATVTGAKVKPLPSSYRNVKFSDKPTVILAPMNYSIFNDPDPTSLSRQARRDRSRRLDISELFGRRKSSVASSSPTPPSSTSPSPAPIAGTSSERPRRRGRKDKEVSATADTVVDSTKTSTAEKSSDSSSTPSVLAPPPLLAARIKRDRRSATQTVPPTSILRDPQPSPPSLPPAPSRQPPPLLVQSRKRTVPEDSKSAPQEDVCEPPKLESQEVEEETNVTSPPTEAEASEEPVPEKVPAVTVSSPRPPEPSVARQEIQEPPKLVPPKAIEVVAEQPPPENVVTTEVTSPPLKKRRRSSNTLHPSGPFPPAKEPWTEFLCPFKYCQRGFRKFQLLQMHIKNYHPQFSRQLLGPSDTPSVMGMAQDSFVTGEKSVGSVDHYEKEMELLKKKVEKIESSKDKEEQKQRRSSESQERRGSSGASAVAPHEPIGTRSHARNQEVVSSGPGRKRKRASEVQIKSPARKEEAITAPVVPKPCSPVFRVIDPKWDVVSCICGSGGIRDKMIMCEACLCWQHLSCEGPMKDSRKTKKEQQKQQHMKFPNCKMTHICQKCSRPKLMRKSMEFKNCFKPEVDGTFGDPFGIWKRKGMKKDVSWERFMKRSQVIKNALCLLSDVERSIQTKLNIVSVPDHPKLVHWAKPWEKIVGGDTTPQGGDGGECPRANADPQDELPPNWQEQLVSFVKDMLQTQAQSPFLGVGYSGALPSSPSAQVAAESQSDANQKLPDPVGTSSQINCSNGGEELMTAPAASVLKTSTEESCRIGTPPNSPAALSEPESRLEEMEISEVETVLQAPDVCASVKDTAENSQSSSDGQIPLELPQSGEEYDGSLLPVKKEETMKSETIGEISTPVIKEESESSGLRTTDTPLCSVSSDVQSPSELEPLGEIKQEEGDSDVQDPSELGPLLGEIKEEERDSKDLPTVIQGDGAPLVETDVPDTSVSQDTNTPEELDPASMDAGSFIGPMMPIEDILNINPDSSDLDLEKLQEFLPPLTPSVPALKRIDLEECRANLVHHISFLQTRLQEEYDYWGKQLETLEKEILEEVGGPELRDSARERMKEIFAAVQISFDILERVGNASNDPEDPDRTKLSLISDGS